MQIRHYRAYILVICFLVMMPARDVAYAANAPAISPTAITNPTQNASYSAMLSCSTNQGSVTCIWQISVGSLPTGLCLGNNTTCGTCSTATSSCYIFGTPAGSGAANFTVRVTNPADGKTGTQDYNVNVNLPISLSPASKTFTNAVTVGTQYTSDLLTASNGATPYTWSSTTLPAGGLCLKTTGGGTCPGTSCNGSTTCYVAGTPTSSAPTSIPVTVKDVNGSTVTNTYTLTINSRVCTTSSNGVIDFGTLDAVADAAGRAEAASYVTTKPTIYCTGGGATYVVTAVGSNGGVNVGTGYNLKNGSNTITYSINYVTPITGQGTTVDIGGTSLTTDLNLKAGFAAGALNIAPAGTYTDTITFTINY